MIEFITDPISEAFDNTVCAISDFGADVTGCRCTREGTGQMPLAANRQAAQQAAQRRAAQEQAANRQAQAVRRKAQTAQRPAPSRQTPQRTPAFSMTTRG